MKSGSKYGNHRVIKPANALPQAAEVLSNDMEIYDNEILIEVESLNIDSASFRQLYEEASGSIESMKARIFSIVQETGKMKNPVTGSGGVLIGRVAQIGDTLKGHIDLETGDKIVSLVSLSLTPLRLDDITAIHPKTDRVDVKGKAILFEKTLYCKLPEDLPEDVAMAVLDVAGAPAQTEKLVHPGDAVLILGAAGKSGMLCAYEARKQAGPGGLVVGVVRNPKNAEKLIQMGFCNKVIFADAQNPLEVLEKALEANDGKEFDISINCLNTPNCEMSCILPVKDLGTVYFFSMATSFTRAALGAEGIAKDVVMIIGNGYSTGHAVKALDIMRESPALQDYFTQQYVKH